MRGTACSLIVHPDTGDHPRTCGEQGRVSHPEAPKMGSPPHMRGTGCVKEKTPFTVRITPAHAGNSDLFADMLKQPQDHPRTCGEQGAPRVTTIAGIGSPPHMRGTEEKYSRQCLSSGITPAHAGNSLSRTYPCSAYSDHPRTCGEQPGSGLESGLYVGSPPHMRGTAYGHEG